MQESNKNSKNIRIMIFEAKFTIFTNYSREKFTFEAILAEKLGKCYLIKIGALDCLNRLF